MSDASLQHCASCNSPEHGCSFEEPDLRPSLVDQILSGRYVDTRTPGCCQTCGRWPPGADHPYFMMRPCRCRRVDDPHAIPAKARALR
jgi:hypothetical protein